MAKQPKLGNGKRFENLVKSIEEQGKVRNPAALASNIGREKYGKSKFQKMAQAGKKKHIRQKI